MRALQDQVKRLKIDPPLTGEYRVDWESWNSLPVLDGSGPDPDDVWAAIREPARKSFQDRTSLSKGKQAT